MSFEDRVIDPASEEMLQIAEEKGHESCFSRYEDMTPQCGFGAAGVCCTICLQGPCRVNPSDNGKGNQEAICGARDYTIVARNLVRTIAGGAANHSGHARHVAEVLREVASGKAEDYEIKDEAKLKNMATALGIEIEGRETNEIVKEVAEEAISNFIGYHGEEVSWLKTAIPESRYNLLNDCDVIPQGINDVIADSMHRTAMGVDSDPLNLIFGGLETALSDFTGCAMGTDLSDILFGTPELVESEANLGVLEEDAVNLVVHGHDPLLSEKVVEAAKRLEDEAKAAGAEKGIKISGICCTGNELLMRQGVSLAANYTSQELAIMTGAVDAMVVDVQCLMPSLQEISRCYHTEIITTMEISKITGAKHIQFNDATAGADADTIVKTAIEAFKKRNAEVNIPDYKSKLMAGFSVEQIVAVLEKVNADDPLSVVTDALASGDIRGIALFAGCNNVKTKQDQNHLKIAKELVKNDVLCVATGCAANSLGKHGLMIPEAVEEYAGEGLKKFIGQLSDAAGVELPLVWHMGSCVDNSRAVKLATALADYTGLDLGELPVVATAPEAMHEKAVSIGSWAVTLGLPTHVGVVPPVTGSTLVTDVATNIAEDVFGGHFIVETDPEAAAEKLIDKIDQRNWMLEMKAKAKEKVEG
ncbi:anaerobic carbon-monoxide dehydrogenase catalytic subunit [Natroniella acetigena]|uniref:anaerobic carbon-monoxide dehydrogenase catalytic subunit n=1 Tax=Natroniella acetigena TaxID=52004 RepID=UPI00200B02BB|nr:anaerobic carbon-monoxide dehydrogenase catalytic subunit [Natroniella acetigena]MCK8827367.1 anaerobic carbon-monoxide dehydrogenase catalytic subunit [Natroniella acetigena]